MCLRAYLTVGVRECVCVYVNVYGEIGKLMWVYVCVCMCARVCKCV